MSKARLEMTDCMADPSILDFYKYIIWSDVVEDNWHQPEALICSFDYNALRLQWYGLHVCDLRILSDVTIEVRTLTASRLTTGPQSCLSWL